jgi:hypothetical protein
MTRFAALCGVAVILACRISANVVDPDIWHEMALAREIISQRHVPRDDTFAYTPTISPVVHHEWGAGIIAYLLATTAGAPGIVALKYALAFAMAIFGWLAARRRGGSSVLLLVLAPVAILMAEVGFSTVRAQMYSLVGAAVLLYLIQLDADGRRRWLAAWLLLFTAWLNLHAGFLVGAGWFALHWLEQLVRRQPHRHLLATGMAMFCLIALNPYGLHYFEYLWHATRLERPYVAEWAPIWQVSLPCQQVMFAGSLLLLSYAVISRGPRNCRGLVIVLVTAFLAALHIRLLPFYALAWFVCLPGYLEPTRLAEATANVWTRWEMVILAAWLAACAMAVTQAATVKPWLLFVPGYQISWMPSSVQKIIYPVGPVSYLKQCGFRGNLMTHFNDGSYVMWKMHPRVKVSMDGRYEVAYPPWLAEENQGLYATAQDWRRVLDRYATDAVLIPKWSALESVLKGSDWPRVYQDDGFAVYTRPGAAPALPQADRSRQKILGEFP